MRAIVVGAGDVGFDVARLLSDNGHDVSVIDADPVRVDRVREALDVQAILGSGTSAETLRAAGVHRATLMVAVTDIDEVNLVACMLSERASERRSGKAPVTIARVRSDKFTGEQAVLTMRDFGIDLLIHPEESTALEVVSLLRRAAATDVIEFCEDRLQLVGMRIDADSPVVGESMSTIAERGSHLVFRVMGIGRGTRTLVPRGDTTIQKGDHIFVLAQTGQVPQVAYLLGKAGARLERVMILGGSKVGARVAGHLSRPHGRDDRMDVVLVEPDPKRATLLAEQLEGVLVINGEASDIDLLVREGLSEMDAVVAVSREEESNLVSCLMAKHLGVRKTVALLSKNAYIPIAQSIGLDAAVSQKLAVTREVMRFLRASHVQSVATLHGLDAEILELEVQPGAPICNGPLASLTIPVGILIGARIGSDIEIATGDTSLKAGDRVIVFVKPDQLKALEILFGGKH